MNSPRSLQTRLAIAITLVLCVSLTLGSALTYWHVVAKVATELRAALAVGAQTAAKAVEGGDEMDPLRRLRRVTEEFSGDRHLEAVLTGRDGHVIARSNLAAPEEPAPDWFTAIVVGRAMHADVPLAAPYSTIGTLRLDADPHNEVAEAWSDGLLTVGIMSMFFTLVLALVFWTVRSALGPLRDLRAALSRVGSGDYTTRMTPHIYRELEPLRQGFDAMAERLEAMRSQNQDLHAQMLNLQEDERAELARDLHDDVAPFLFSVGADAAMIRQFLVAGTLDQVAPRAEAIAEAVRHMQKHLKGVLRRLAPETLIDLGLAGALDNLVGFWRLRQSGIVFSLDVNDTTVEPPLDAIVFRVVQESLSNAIRHGGPSMITIRLRESEGHLVIRIEDDGTGLGKGSGIGLAGHGLAGEALLGFGLASMRDRVRAVGGRLAVRDRTDGQGVIVEATLPCVEKHETIAVGVLA